MVNFSAFPILFGKRRILMLFYIFYIISCKAAHKGYKQLRQSERVHTGLGDDGNSQNRLSAGGYRHFAQPLTGLYRRGERLRQVERGLHIPCSRLFNHERIAALEHRLHGLRGAERHRQAGTP